MTNGGRCVAGYGTRAGCGLLTLSQRSQPKPVVGTGGGQTASGAVGRDVRPRRPGGDRAGRYDRAALGRKDRRPGHLPGSGAFEHGHFVKASGLRWLSAMLLDRCHGHGECGAAVPDRADAVAALGRAARRPPQVAGRRCPADAPLDGLGTGPQVARWLPDRRIVAIADSGFSAIDLLGAVRGHVCVVTRLRLDARLGCRHSCRLPLGYRHRPPARPIRPRCHP